MNDHVDTSRAEKGRVEVFDVVCGHDEDSAFDLNDAVDRVEEG